MSERQEAAEQNAYDTMAERYPDRIFGGPNGNVPEDDPLWAEWQYLVNLGM